MTDKTPPRPKTYTRPTHVGDQPPTTLAGELDELKAHVLVLSGEVREWIRRTEGVETRLKEHEHAHNLPRYRSELPSETSLSLRPTRAHITLRNWRPTSWVLVVLILAVVVVVWLFRR